jgi:cyclopropane-fatty-acyl-phospholipid synthase
LEAAHEAALKFVTEPTYRVWRLYMAGSAHGFDCARLAIYQTLLVRPDTYGRVDLPLTRRDWYEGNERSGIR